MRPHQLLTFTIILNVTLCCPCFHPNKISFNEYNANNSHNEVWSGVARCGVVEYNYNHFGNHQVTDKKQNFKGWKEM